LAPLRDVADEIVVAVDSRAPHADFSAFTGLADRLLRFDFADYVERSLSWLHSECSSDWILRLDGDEVVSPDLVRQLRELIADPNLAQYYIPRRWLYPDTGRWLREWPWYPDFQNRLVRNDSRLWFSGLCHSGAVAALPARYLEAPIYHLDCVFKSEQERERKVAAYLAVPAGAKAVGADRLVATYYLPERYAERRPVAVQPEDRKAIAAVLAAEMPGTGRESRRWSRRVPLVNRSEIDRHWAERELPSSAYRGRVALVDGRRDLTFRPREQRLCTVRVTNLGTEAWPGFADRRPLIRLGCRWLKSDLSLIDDTARTVLTGPLEPGGTAIVPAFVQAPIEPGSYVLQFDLVHEFVRWFGSQTQARVTVTSDSEQRALRAALARG